MCGLHRPRLGRCEGPVLVVSVGSRASLRLQRSWTLRAFPTRMPKMRTYALAETQGLAHATRGWERNRREPCAARANKACGDGRRADDRTPHPPAAGL